MLEGPESPKSPHKLVLPENVSISALYTVIMGFNSFYMWSNKQCCKNEAILNLKRDFCPCFSAKVFKRTGQTLLIPKIYILDYIKKYIKQLRFLEPEKNTRELDHFSKSSNFEGSLLNTTIF